MARLGPGLRVCQRGWVGLSWGRTLFSAHCCSCWQESAPRRPLDKGLHFSLAVGRRPPLLLLVRALSSSKKANEKSQGMLARQKSVFCNCISKETVPPLLSLLAASHQLWRGVLLREGVPRVRDPPGPSPSSKAAYRTRLRLLLQLGSHWALRSHIPCPICS